MALNSNRPDLARLKRKLLGVNLAELLTGADPGDIDLELQDVLDTSIAQVEEQHHTQFDGAIATGPDRIYDGNGTNQIVMRVRPVTYVAQVKVSLPVLALNREYFLDEIKDYRDQGIIKIFTYKLATEHAFLRLDQQIYGNIFPSLPKSIEVDFTYGFGQYDPDSDLTSYDGTAIVNGGTVQTGDTRTRAEKKWLRNLQEAALLDAAAAVLEQLAAQAFGSLTSVSFDGYSKSFNPQAYAAQAGSMRDRRDQLLAHRKVGYWSSTAG